MGPFSTRPTAASADGSHLVLIVPEEAEEWALARKAELEAKRASRSENGAGCQTRTGDLMITNQLLYQLS